MYGLEVPMVYDFLGPAKFVEWLKGKLQNCKTNLDKKIYYSKRKSYMEFKGRIKFRVNNCSLLIEDRNIFNNKIFKIVSKNNFFQQYQLI